MFLLRRLKMRLPLPLVVPALLLLPPVQAAAQPVAGIVEIDGSVADRCLFTTPSETISVGELALGGTGTQAGRLDVTKLNGQTRTLAGWCNGTAATISVEAMPLLNRSFQGAAPTGFDTRINYDAAALANRITATDSSITAGAGTTVPVGLFTGDIVVTISGSSTPTGGLLVAGVYSSKIIVTLTPNVSFGGGSK